MGRAEYKLSMQKTCKDCCSPLDASLFSKDKSYSDGLAVRCKVCKKKRYNPQLAEWRRNIRDEALRAKDGISLRYVQDRISLYKSRAKKANYAFDLDSQYLLNLWKKQCGLCFYSKQKMQIIHLKFSFWSPSLDRRDPDKGYTKGNVVWALHGVNCFKQQLTFSEFRDFLTKVQWNFDLSHLGEQNE